MDNGNYKWIMGLNYLLFFGFISWTSRDEISYVFILPLISILILYKNPKLIKVMMWGTLLVLFSSNLYKGLALGMMEFVSSVDCALQFASVLCCYSCTNMAIKHLVESDGALTDSIAGNLERVVKTVEKVKVASNEVVDGVTVVRELADENRMGAENVVTDMHELSNENSILSDRTMSSVEMTNAIETQMTNVTELMEQVVNLIEASVVHANISSEELVEVVETTNKMASLSAQVEKVLGEFKVEFENVKNETVELIQVNIDKVSSVERSVTDITNDATALGANIKIVDSAVKEVEASNRTLADNMQQVCSIMENMTERVNSAEVTTKEMLSKYEESANSAVDIETVVGHLMEELGVGGFMGVQDVRAEMKIAVVFHAKSATRKEYIGEVAERVDKELYIMLEDNNETVVDSKEKNALCELHIVVDNVLYHWDNIEIHPVNRGEKGNYKLIVETNPKVFNRRKYPRMPLANTCSIKVKGSNESYQGRMVNISANGFAFAVKEEMFSDMKGKNVVVEIKDFEIMRGNILEGCIIRSSNNDGEYIIGCRMPQDCEIIEEYVNKNYIVNKG